MDGWTFEPTPVEQAYLAGYFDGKGWTEAEVTPERILEASEALRRFYATLEGRPTEN
jgi:hypothetical protein